MANLETSLEDPLDYKFRSSALAGYQVHYRSPALTIPNDKIMSEESKVTKLRTDVPFWELEGAELYYRLAELKSIYIRTEEESNWFKEFLNTNIPNISEYSRYGKFHENLKNANANYIVTFEYEHDGPNYIYHTTQYSKKSLQGHTVEQVTELNLPSTVFKRSEEEELEEVKRQYKAKFDV